MVTGKRQRHHPSLPKLNGDRGRHHNGGAAVDNPVGVPEAISVAPSGVVPAVTAAIFAVEASHLVS